MIERQEIIDGQTNKLNAGLRAWKRAVGDGIDLETQIQCGHDLETLLEQAFVQGMRVEVVVKKSLEVEPRYQLAFEELRLVGYGHEGESIVFPTYGVTGGSLRPERRKLGIGLVTGRGGVSLALRDRGAILTVGVEEIEDLRCVWPTPHST